MTTLHRIRERLAEVRQQIEGYKRSIATLQFEQIELETAEKVMLRFSGEEADDAEEADLLELEDHQYESRKVEVGSVHARAKNGGRRKPAGLPSMAEMIIAAIEDYADGEREALEPKEISRYIAVRWWPEVRSSNVGPIAWRMARAGQLVASPGGAYALPKKETPAVSPDGVPELSSGSAGLIDHPAVGATKQEP